MAGLRTACAPAPKQAGAPAGCLHVRASRTQCLQDPSNIRAHAEGGRCATPTADSQPPSAIRAKLKPGVQPTAAELYSPTASVVGSRDPHVPRSQQIQKHCVFMRQIEEHVAWRQLEQHVQQLVRELRAHPEAAQRPRSMDKGAQGVAEGFKAYMEDSTSPELVAPRLQVWPASAFLALVRSARAAWMQRRAGRTNTLLVLLCAPPGLQRSPAPCRRKALQYGT